MAHVEFGNALKHKKKEKHFIRTIMTTISIHIFGVHSAICKCWRWPIRFGFMLSLANRFGKCPNFICESRTKQTAGRSAQKGHHIIWKHICVCNQIPFKTRFRELISFYSLLLSGCIILYVSSWSDWNNCFSTFYKMNRSRSISSSSSGGTCECR